MRGLSNVWTLAGFLGLFLLSQTGCRTSQPLEGDGWRLYGSRPLTGQALLFAPGIVSTEAFEMNSAFGADGREFYFTRANGDWSEMTLLVSRWDDGMWSRPEVLPFNGDYANADPTFSPGHERLYFASKRDPLGSKKEDFDLWYVDRLEDEWGEPVPLTRLNSSHEEVSPFPTLDRTLYFTSRRPAGTGKYDVYRARWDGSSYDEPQLLDPPVNTPLTEVDATLSQDGNLLFFASHGREDSHGKGDIYVCFKRKGAWSSPVNLGEPVNSEAMELCPKLAPDGRTLFFASTRNVPELRQGEGGMADLYLVDLAGLQVMKDAGWIPPGK
ncbi:hypothetical protein KQI63_11455 [bacterium]|nr:hypothetical protein [bacterium]